MFLLLLLPTTPIHLKLLVVPSLAKQPVVITAVGYNIHAFLGDNLLENIQHNYSGCVNILQHSKYGNSVKKIIGFK